MHVNSSHTKHIDLKKRWAYYKNKDDLYDVGPWSAAFAR